MKKILIVDDERDIAECLDMNLRKKGYDTVSAYDGTEAVLTAKRERPDCILLDLMLPKINGIEVCRLLKADESTMNIPVIMLTAKGEEDDKVTGFDAGADDYITKPFGWRELFARIEVALRRSQPVSSAGAEDLSTVDEGLHVKDLTIYPDKYLVEQGGKRVDLTPTEFGILKVLAEHRGYIVTRGELMEALGAAGNGGEIRSLDVHLRNLRKKLGDDVQECRYIETIRKMGFRVNE